MLHVWGKRDKQTPARPDGAGWIDYCHSVEHNPSNSCESVVTVAPHNSKANTVYVNA